MIIQYNHQPVKIEGKNIVSVGDLRSQLLLQLGLPSVAIIDHGKLLKDDSLSLLQLSEGMNTKLNVFGAKETITKEFKVDPLLRDDFCQPVTRKAKRKLNTGDRLVAPPSYGFQAVQTLSGLHSEKKARKILNSLANDPGILAVMRNNKWLVSELCEMYPDGYVGVSEVCVLGLNENRGQRIKLRIRTDDLTGFRKYLSIKKVLYHELAHNVHSDHNSDFYMLMREIEREANALDWTQTRGHALNIGSVKHSSEEDSEPDFDDSDNDEEEVHRLGGATQLLSTILPPRAMAGGSAVNRLQGSVYSSTVDNEMIVEQQKAENFIPDGLEQTMDDVSQGLSHKAAISTNSADDVYIDNNLITERAEDISMLVTADNDSQMEVAGLNTVSLTTQPSEPSILEPRPTIASATDLMELVGSALDEPISMLALSAGMQASLEKAIALKEAATHLLFEIEEKQESVLPTYRAIIKLLLAICTNAKDRTETKYRHIKKTSGAYIRNLKPYASVIAIMKAAGFVEVEEEFCYERNDIALLYIFCSCLELIFSHLPTQT